MNYGGDAADQIVRYSDVLLMVAEAENELNGPDAAYDYLNKVRELSWLWAYGARTHFIHSGIRYFSFSLPHSSTRTHSYPSIVIFCCASFSFSRITLIYLLA